MARGKELRAGGMGGPAQPIQGQRESLSQHTWNPMVAHQCVNPYHWAHQVGTLE